MPKDQRDGLLIILVAASGYAFLPIITKNIYAVSDFTPTDIALWRFLFATPLLWLFVSRSNSTFTRQDHPLPRRTLMLMGILYAIAALTSFLGLERLPASMFVVLFYTYPAMVALFSLLIGERLQPIAWIALGLTLVGVVFTVPDLSELSGGDAGGILFAALNAAAVAVYFMVSNRVLRGHQAVARGTAYVMTGTLICLVLLIGVTGIHIPPNLDTWANILALATVSTAFPMFAINVGIQKVGAARASIISAIQPVQTMLLALVLLGEVILPLQWVGGIFIVLSVILLQIRGRQPDKTEEKADKTETPASPAMLSSD